MKIKIIKKPLKDRDRDDISTYRPSCPACGESRDHTGLLWQAAGRHGRMDKVPGIEELNIIHEGIFFTKGRYFQCHTCGCEWRVTK